MITIISGSNRPNNLSEKVALFYQSQLELLGHETAFFSCANVPLDILEADVYENAAIHAPEFDRLQKELLFPATKYLFVVPEYNGSFTGVLKLLIDAARVKKAFYYKKAALVGVASGRAGNLRGMDHLTNILLHLKMEVLPNKLPISKIEDEIDEEGHIYRKSTLKAVNRQIQEFIAF